MCSSTSLKNIFFLILILFSILNLYSAEDDHDHEHGDVTRGKIIDEIAEHIKATTKKGDHTVFLFKDFKNIVDDLFFQNCSKELKSLKCNLCATPEDFFKWFKHDLSKQLSEEELAELNVGIVYFLSEHHQENNFNSINDQSKRAVCKSFTTKVLSNQKSNLFNLYLEKYNHNGNQLTEKNVETILSNVNKTIGRSLTGTKCFSAHDVLKAANASAKGFGKHDLEYVTSFIVLQLLDKKCIKMEDDDHDHTHEDKDLVQSTFFINKIFKEYGKNKSMTHEDFEKLYKALFPKANQTAAKTTGGHDGHDEHDGHGHKRKRRSVDAGDKCHSAENLLKIYKVPKGSSLDHGKFQEMCPSLVQQMESGVCTPPTANGAKKEKKKDTWQPWVAAMIAISVISFGSLIGAVIFPGKEKKWFPYVIMFLIALGVSVLICDAILHLIPHALNLHGHEKGGHGHEKHANHEGEDPFKKDSYLWKCLLVLAGVYLFFAFEILMHAFGRGHSHSHHGAHAHDHAHHHHEIELGSPLSNGSLTKNYQDLDDVVISNDNACKSEKEVGNGNGYPKELAVVTKVTPTDDDFSVKYKNGHANGVTVSNGHVTTEKKKFKYSDVKSLAWMILIGDSIHNFMDGVAIGVAFSEPFPAGLHGGISTSIAILCHEIPHELSDFAVLIASGLSIKQSLIMNLISSLTAFAGGIVGVSLGTTWDAAPWIFSVTAGLFIYIALVDMLPEIMNSPLLKKSPVASILLDMLGLIIGLVIMFVLGAWEEDIEDMLK